MARDSAEALRLEEEGSALSSNRNYPAAYKKYTNAIQYDDKNAVPYANRAACSQNMARFADAVSDASKATKVDPGYPKAWARLATAQRISPIVASAAFIYLKSNSCRLSGVFNKASTPGRKRSMLCQP